MKTKYSHQLSFLFLILPFLIFAQNEKYHRVKILFDTENGIKELAALGVEADHGEYSRGQYLINDFSERELQTIAKKGFKYEVLINDVSSFYKEQVAENVDRVDWACKSQFNYPHQKPQNFKLGKMGGFYTYQELLDILADMKAKYPKLITAAQPIDTFRTFEKRPIYFLKISDNPDKKEPSEAQVFYNALHHAREPAGLSQLIYYMWYVLENYDKSTEIKYLVDSSELYFVPCVNPDGYVYNETIQPSGGGLWRKNRRVINNNSVGVDLNRNYDFKWAFDDDGSSPSPDAETYRGESGFSEPETQAVKFLCEKNKFATILNYHSYGNLLIYPWAYSDKVADTIFIQLAKVLTRYNQYQEGSTTETVGYSVNGDSDDWMYGAVGAISFTPEVSEGGFWISKEDILPTCADNLYQNIVTAQVNLQTAIVTNSTPHFVNQNTKITFDILRIGSRDGSFKVNLLPISTNVIANNPSIDFNLKRFERKSSFFNFQVKQGTPTGAELRFLIGLYNGSYFKYDTLRLIYNPEASLLADNANNTTNWISTGKTWATTTSTFTSAPSCITDSPSGNYQNDEITTFTSKNYISLPKKGKIILRFWTKWDIEKDRDYAMVSIATSANPNAYTALCGKYSKAGGFLQAYNAPLYDEKSDWVLEEIDLSAYAGKSVLIQFELVTDDNGQRDGIYIDDLYIDASNPLTTATETIVLDDFIQRVYPNPSSDFFKIELKNGFLEKNITIFIFDAFGKKILEKNIQNADNELLIDIKNIQSGAYFYQIKGKNFSSRPEKLIILK